MQGPKQHHIPQMLQRGFHIRGQRNWTWRFARGCAPERAHIPDIGAEDHFYSDAPADGSATLDGRITKFEGTRFGSLLTSVKRQEIGSDVDAGDAALIVAHLSLRAAHFRDVLSKGLKSLAAGVAEAFSDPIVFERIFGFDAGEPTQRFRATFDQEIAARPEVQASGIPLDVVERMAFALARENFESLFEEQHPKLRTALQLFAAQSERLARSGHNKGLEADLEGATRRDHLACYTWRLEPAPPEGAIMPDCVAVGLATDDSMLPYMVGDQDAFAAIVMPISASKLLVGRSPDAPAMSPAGLNERLAECCEAFFIAATDNPVLSDLSSAIGTRSSLPVDEAVEEALSEYRAGPPKPASESVGDEDVEANEASRDPMLPLGGWQLSLLDCAGDAEWVERVKVSTFTLVTELARNMPLMRLDGITFAADYPAALRALDRGVPGAQPLEATANEVGVGIAMSPAIIRDGIIKRRVVAVAALADALISEVEHERTWAIHALGCQLAVVALSQIVDEALPETLMKPIDNPIDRFLYPWVSDAIDGYIVARECARYGYHAYAEEQRTLLVGALNRARETIPAARFDYRYHADMRQLLHVTMPAVGFVLNAAAHLLGHCDGLQLSPFDEQGRLENALQECGLLGWFAQFRRDLASFCDRIGRWESFVEFLAFNRHVERVVWQFGLVPFETANGGLHVEVPLATDAVKLLEATARGVPLPQRPQETT
jgi:hypothetical protein